VRIVGGALGGRRFAGPPGRETRPTGERVREALGSLLEARDVVRGAAVLDLFAGTGALGFEMLSRGADHALLVDRDRRAVRSMKESARTLGLDRARVMTLDLLADAAIVADRLATEGPFSLVLADPPWSEAARVPALLLSLSIRGALGPGATMVLEHGAREAPKLPAGLASVASYRYGDTALLVAQAGDAPR